MEDGAEGLAEQLSGAGWLPTPSRPLPCIHTHTHSCVSKELLRPGPWGGEGWANPIHTPRFSAEHEAKATRGFFLTSAFSGRHHHHPCLQFCWKQRHRLQSKAGAELWAEGKVVPRLLSKWVQRVLATPPQGQSTGHQHLPEAPMDTAAAPGRGRGEGGYTLCHTNTDMAQGRCGLGETRGHRKRPGKSAHRYRLAHWKQCPYWEEQTPGKSRNGSLLPIHPGPHLSPSSQGGRGAPGRTRANLAASSSPTSSL